VDAGRAGKPARVEPQEVFDRLYRRLLAEHPEDERGRMLHSAGLKTSGKVYAFTTGGELVVKLSAGRVSELIARSEGRPCEPRRGRPMREWVRLSPPDLDACAAYVRKARSFVAAPTNPTTPEHWSETGQRERRSRPAAQKKGA
jgi:hypothetical protein